MWRSAKFESNCLMLAIEMEIEQSNKSMQMMDEQHGEMRLPDRYLAYKF